MVDQILPDSTSFVAGTTALADSPQLYAPILPWSGPTTTWNIECEVGSMGDRDGGATFVPYSPSPTERRLGWCVWDQVEQSDGSAKVYPELRVLSGSITADTFGGIGVCARVQSGTWTNVGDADGYLSVPNGYYFIHSHKPSTGDRLFLLRVFGGTVFQVSTKLLTPNPGGLFVLPQPMRIQCTGNLIQCFRPGSGGPVDASDYPVGFAKVPTADEDAVFSVEDNSPFVITSPGRYGFGLMQPMNDSGLQTVTVANQFDLKDPSGALVVRDKFERAYPNAARSLVDGLGRGMKSVMSAFTGDYHGSQFIPPYFRNLQADTGNRVKRGPQININGANQGFGWHISQRPASSTDQSRELRFHFANIDASNDRTASILLRGNFAGTTPPLEWDGTAASRSGYQCEVSWDQGGAPQFRVNLIDMTGFSGSPQLIATAGLPGIALGTDHILKFSVDGSPARMRVEFNGTAVSTWVIPSLLPGVTTFGEYVTDSRSSHHATGGLEGFFFRAQSYNASALVWFSYWGPGPSVGGSGGVDPSSYATFPVPLEDYNASSDVFQMDQGWPASVEDQKLTIIQRVQSGDVFRIAGGSRFRRRWPVNLSGRTKAELDYVEAFFAGKRGGEIPFRWLATDTDELVLVRFKGGSMDAIRKALGGQAATFELEEVFEYA